MRMRLAILLLFASSLQRAADSHFDGAHLLAVLAFQLESGASDYETALLVERAELSQQISEEDVRWVERQGAGAGTMAALDALRKRSASLPTPEVPLVTRQPHPSQQQVNDLFLKADAYVLHYLNSLIDFTCKSRTDVSVKQPRKDGFSEWKRRTTVRETIRFEGGREQVLDDKGKETWPAKKRVVGNSWSSGEFANIMRMTFSLSSHGKFAWDHWERWGGRRTGVFSFSVEAVHSKFGIDTQVFRGGEWKRQELFPGYHGYVYVDADSGAVLRLIANTSRIPSEFAVNQGNTILDYTDIEISGKHFLLLSSATTYLNTKHYQTLFEKSFGDYHRFEAESKVIMDR